MSQTQQDEKNSLTRRGESTMDPKIEAFVMALNDFVEAALILGEEMERASDELGDCCAQGYPFPNSFDEVAYSIRLWAERVRKRLTQAA
jgi:hypothetical protein